MQRVGQAAAGAAARVRWRQRRRLFSGWPASESVQLGGAHRTSVVFCLCASLVGSLQKGAGPGGGAGAAAEVARQRLSGMRWQVGGRGLGGRALRWCALFGPRISPSRALQPMLAGERQLQILCFNRQPFFQNLSAVVLVSCFWYRGKLLVLKTPVGW